MSSSSLVSMRITKRFGVEFKPLMAWSKTQQKAFKESDKMTRWCSLVMGQFSSMLLASYRVT